MSIRVMAVVWELDLDQTDKLILLAISDHADDSGFCYPSLARIAWKCGVSKDTIRRSVARLCNSGVLSILEKGDGRGHSTRYRVFAGKGSKLQPFDRERVANETEKGSKSDVKGSTAMLPESSVLESSKHNRTLDSSPPPTKSERETLFEDLRNEWYDKKRRGEMEPGVGISEYRLKRLREMGKA